MRCCWVPAICDDWNAPASCLIQVLASVVSAMGKCFKDAAIFIWAALLM
jgi:hypothetical protein